MDIAGSSRPQPRTQTRMEQLETIDNAISIMEEVGNFSLEKIRDMKHVRNEISPISKLSVEIYQEIFFLVSMTEDYDERYRHYGKRKNEWDWVTITKVSKRWREVALGCPVLWTQIVLYRRPDRIKAYIERSRDADLYLVGGKTRFPYRNTLLNSADILSTVSNRIREFKLSECISYMDWQYLLRLFTTGPMTRMRKLQLESDGASLIGDSKEPLAFMSEARLSYLSLLGFSIPWGHHILRGLSELTLEEVDHKPMVPELLEILESCPVLKSLKLKDAGPMSSTAYTAPSRSVSMRHLRNISIEDFNYNTCKELFDSLTLSSNKIVVSIACFKYPFSKPEPFPLNLLDERVDRSKVKIKINDRGISFSTCEDEENRRVTITLSWQDGLDDSESSESLIDALGGETSESLTTSMRSISVMLSQPFWGSITSVDLVVYDGEDEEFEILDDLQTPTWITFLDQLPAIEDLKVSMAGEMDLAKHFVQAFTQSSDKAPYNFKCPHLRTLDLVDFAFSYSNHDHNNLEEYYTLLMKHLSFPS